MELHFIQEHRSNDPKIGYKPVATVQGRWKLQTMTAAGPKPNNVPAEIAPTYDELRSEVTWLHGRWECYRQLFAESQKRIDMLSEAADTFFHFVDELLYNDVQLMLSKLTDPAQTKTKAGTLENLSLEHLQTLLEKRGDKALADRCRKLLDTLHDQCKDFRIRRHKKLAHLDKEHALKPHLLPGISRQMIEDALSTTREYLNEIERHYNDSEWGYEHFIMTSGAESLLGVLRQGLRYEELRQEGKLPSFDDWRNGRWHDA